MSKDPALAPVRHFVVVEASIVHAFKVFTEDFGRFKPREHNLLAVPIAETIFEPRVGGHVYDRGVDGSECRWARVLAYDPPSRLVLSWDISPRWQIETDPNKTSEWEVRFTAETENRTRVEIEHRHFERHGQGWEGVRGAVDSDQGWPLYLQRFHGLFNHRAA
ncbi:MULTISPECIES: SRPBCC family protein [unclassified Mesorhizobium]|uniref:SRPBCC family protein n=1 Tax=unclassified Mesorhizobium TaxID=325217 RepID=UPI001127D2B7|nr:MULTISPECIES: SRPBCC family protein [unclassified Mesorhizobium]MCA0054698.1 SRPBCC family protein [Mesorhizobium sp. B261B1A]TPK51717.1 ATPase [Mesorhizobium sp. B2-5-2]TPL14528.1 ATPase [Mesorhizobium sp. B2-4-11]TPL15573.1 ATPase [Mesorhizobium sp. B2-4-9]TPL30675.1 ATPase [Mesorhizobium sp. B2-4-7]